MNTCNNIYTIVISMALVVGLTLATAVFGADDPSIKGSQRQYIIASMNQYIQDKTIDDTYHLFDAVKGKLLRLQFKKLHDGIVKKGSFYVSCADFVDQSGRLVDVDFMVMSDGNDYKTTQGIVHAVDGKKRKYHLE